MFTEPRKFYAVQKGRKPGIYLSWKECEEQVKGFPGSVHKSFKCRGEAEEFLGIIGVAIDDGSPLLNEVPGPSPQNLDIQNIPATLEADKHLVYCLEFDGASKGNPGRAGAGALLRDPHGKPVLAVKVGAGMVTNNVAEYLGLIHGLKVAISKGVKHIRVQGDSSLVCNQVVGRWKVSKPHLMPLCEEAKELSGKFQSFKIRHVFRAENPVADRLANQGVALKGTVKESTNCTVKIVTVSFLQLKANY